MTTILLVDDHLFKRKKIIEALSNRYEFAEIDHPNPTSMMIKKVEPSMILINKLSFSFDPLTLFFNIKELYPKMPVLFYVLNGPDAIKTLEQAIFMALGEKKVISGIKTDQAGSFLADQIGVVLKIFKENLPFEIL